MMNMILTNQSTVPLNQESIITNEDSTNRPELPQQALEFLAPFRELYSDNNYTTAEKAILIHELTMTLQEAKHRTRYIYSNSVGSHFLNICMIQFQVLIIDLLYI